MKKEKKNYVGSETPPTLIEEKETLWSEEPYVYPHQVYQSNELVKDISGLSCESKKNWGLTLCNVKTN